MNAKGIELNANITVKVLKFNKTKNAKKHKFMPIIAVNNTGIIRARTMLRDARGIRLQICYFYPECPRCSGTLGAPRGLLGTPRGSLRIPEARRPPRIPEARGYSGILGVNREHDREYSASSGLLATSERNGQRSRDICL